MHFSKEVIRQSAVVIETTEVCAAHVADLQLLVTGGAGGVLEVLEFPLAGFFLVFGGAGFVELVVCLSDGAGLTQDGDFEKASVDCFGEVRDLFELWKSISSPLRYNYKSKERVAEGNKQEKEKEKKNTYKIIRLPNLIRRLLQPSLSRINSPVTIVDILLHITHIVKLKAPFRLLGRRSQLVFRLQSLTMHLGTRTQVLFGIGEEIMRTGPGQV